MKNLPKNYTKGPWSNHEHFGCKCNQILGADDPICEVTRGNWGDDFPSLRLVGDSLALRAEAFMEQITYGEVADEVASANALLITAAPLMVDALMAFMTAHIDNGGQTTDELYKQGMVVLKKALVPATVVPFAPAKTVDDITAFANGYIVFKPEIAEWLEKTAKGYYGLRRHRQMVHSDDTYNICPGGKNCLDIYGAYFEHKEDAALFKLFWL